MVKEKRSLRFATKTIESPDRQTIRTNIVGHPELDKDIQPIGTIFSITPQPVKDAIASVSLAKAFGVKLSLRKKKKSVSPKKSKLKSKATIRSSKSVDPIDKEPFDKNDSVFDILDELAKLEDREVEEKMKSKTDRKILDFKAV